MFAKEESKVELRKSFSVLFARGVRDCDNLSYSLLNYTDSLFLEFHIRTTSVSLPDIL